MTNPEYGEDFVAARLSVDIPEGSAAGIREITQEAERLRTTLEAVTRTDMASYLEGMANAARRAAEAQANLTEQLQHYLALSTQGQSPSMGVPMGAAIDPFRAAPHPSARPPDPADVSSQIEQMRTTNPREYLNMQQARGGLTAQDTTNISPQSIQEMATKISDREQAQREQVLHTDPTAQPTKQEEESGASEPLDYEGYAGKIARGASLAGRVANEIGPGGSLVGMGRLAMQGVNWAKKKYSAAADRNQGSPPAQEVDANGAETDGASKGATSEVADSAKGFGIGAIASKLGIVGAAITGAIGLFEGVQKGGQAIQGLRNEASVRGGAAGEGAQVEMRARMLSMNPFISQDQARQIYQSVMSEGYADASGAGADNVIDFMKTNLTTMNMSVADSAKLLRGTIVGQREGDPDSVNHSLGQLREELDKIRTTSRGTMISTPEFTAGAMGLKNTLMAAGANAATAGQIGIDKEGEYGDDPALREQMAKGSGDMMGSASGQALMKTFGGLGSVVPADLPPQLTTAYVSHMPGGAEILEKAQDQTLKHFAVQCAAGYKGDEGSFLKSVYMFQLYCKTIVPSQDAASSLDAAKQLFSKLTGIAEPESGAGSGAGGDGGGGATSSDAGSGAPSGGGARSAPAPSGGATGGGGTQHISVGQGNVQITLTPEASRLLKVQGPNPAPLTSLQTAANRGQADSYPNGSS
jgi:hypothetical protein